MSAVIDRFGLAWLFALALICHASISVWSSWHGYDRAFHTDYENIFIMTLLYISHMMVFGHQSVYDIPNDGMSMAAQLGIHSFGFLTSLGIGYRLLQIVDIYLLGKYEDKKARLDRVIGPVGAPVKLTALVILVAMVCSMMGSITYPIRNDGW